jgi:hypothetical protein
MEKRTIENKPVTHVTDVTHYINQQGSDSDILGDVDTLTHAQITRDMTENNYAKEGQIPLKGVTSVIPVTEAHIDNIPLKCWNGRTKEVVPMIFGDLRYLGRLTKQGTFIISQDAPKK